MQKKECNSDKKISFQIFTVYDYDFDCVATLLVSGKEVISSNDEASNVICRMMIREHYL